MWWLLTGLILSPILYSTMMAKFYNEFNRSLNSIDVMVFMWLSFIAIFSGPIVLLGILFFISTNSGKPHFKWTIQKEKK